ncbi:MAG: sigma-54-dependent Fis family transcriptional regulator [Deltaproteobacteria bacterium]|nr:MAG: sigma-54-dependent Fis family transcriptional regulator [Deltaproteobacteria bacterium]
MKYILIATEDDAATSTIRDCFDADHVVETARDRESCLAKFIERHYEFLFIDISFLGLPEQTHRIDFDEVLKPFWNAFPTCQIVLLSSPEDIRRAVMAVKAGVNDYLTYPINPTEVALVTEAGYESLRTQSELEYLRDKFWKDESQRVIYTLNPAMKKVFDKVKSVAPTKTTVLLTGETGTGKGELAKLIHLHSNRCDNQFISVHCGAIPDTLIESEFFGHEKGAFTGAVRRKLGRFEIAQGGTIFLDEISSITQSVQIKLLQVLQEKTFSRVGGETEIKADVRVVAASNEDIEGLVESGNFRKDLYYRLNVFPVAIPPLRERLEDIPFLVQGFLEELNRYYFKNIHTLHPAVMAGFRRYQWPGNIRELENILERAYIIEQSNILTTESFPAELFGGEIGGAQIRVDTSRTLAEVREEAIESVERQYLREQLNAHKGRINLTAATAGISTRQLHKLLKKYEIRKEDFKSAKNNSVKNRNHRFSD